jgi:uncharacterized protein (TIGR02284 family)
MANDNAQVISTLNNLIETCKDGENGFRTAADGVENSELKTLFLTYSQQRAQFAAELQTEVRNLGGDPEDTGSVAASLHRGWINIKSVVTGEDEGAIISECERGEDSAVRNYKDALNENLPANIQATVQRQYTQVKEAHDRIRALEKADSARA